MFLSTVLLALVVGVLAGGGIPRLAELRLRWSWLLLLALLIQLLAGLSRQTGIGADIPVGWAYIVAYGLIFIWLWGNWKVPGLQIASVGIAANMVAVIINVGQMPIWSAAFFAAGFTPADIANDPFHFLLQTDSVADFVARGGIFGDVVPLPVPIIRDVVSLGDILLALGIFWAIVYSMIRVNAPSRGAYAIGPTTILRAATATPGTAGAAYAESGSIPADLSEAGAEAAGLRRQSPYLRLFANRNFSLLWTGQLISLIGDRIHVIALGALVATRGTALEVGIVFAMTAVPSVFLGPLAGVLVDRWDRRRTMIACDLSPLLPRAARAAGVRGPHRPGLRDRLRDRHGDPPLPPGEDRGHPRRRRGARPRGRQLGAVGAGDRRRPHRLPDRRHDRHGAQLGARRGLRARLRHLRRLGGPAVGDDPAAPGVGGGRPDLAPRRSGARWPRASPSSGASRCCSRTRCSRRWRRSRSAPRSS